MTYLKPVFQGTGCTFWGRAFVHNGKKKMPHWCLHRVSHYVTIVNNVRQAVAAKPPGGLYEKKICAAGAFGCTFAGNMWYEGKNNLGERVEIVYAPDGSHVDRIYETGGAHRNLGCGRQSDRCLQLNFIATKTASLRDLSHGAGPFFDSRVSRRCGIR
jgi:hypothetical protein